MVYFIGIDFKIHDIEHINWLSERLMNTGG